MYHKINMLSTISLPTGIPSGFDSFGQDPVEEPTQNRAHGNGPKLIRIPCLRNQYEMSSVQHL